MNKKELELMERVLRAARFNLCEVDDFRLEVDKCLAIIECEKEVKQMATDWEVTGMLESMKFRRIKAVEKDASNAINLSIVSLAISIGAFVLLLIKLAI